MGGALDGSDRRIAVFLTIRRATALDVVTDIREPVAAPRAR
jgi:hypothetical protein